jgi:hypothetical protein
VDSSFYDVEGNRVKRKVGSFYNDSLRYDVRGKVTKAEVPSGMRETDLYYSGMGRLVASRWDNTINADFGVEERPPGEHLLHGGSFLPSPARTASGTSIRAATRRSRRRCISRRA